MQNNHEMNNAVAARCVVTSYHLRKLLVSGEKMDWNVRRDIATAANLLEAVSIKLDKGQQNRGKMGHG